MVCSQNLYLGDSGSFRETALSVFQIFLTGRILEFTTDRFQNHCVDFDLVFFQARVQALSRVFPDYEDNAPTMSESAFNRMTYPRWEEGCKDEVESTFRPISEPPSPVSTRPSSPERRSRPGSPGARWFDAAADLYFSLKLCNSRSIYSMNSDDSASHDSEEELDALELDQN